MNGGISVFEGFVVTRGMFADGDYLTCNSLEDLR